MRIAASTIAASASEYASRISGRDGEASGTPNDAAIRCAGEK